MNQTRRSFYNGWTSQSSNNLHSRRPNTLLSSIDENESFEEQLFHLEKDIFSIQRELLEIKDEITLLRYDTTKISEYIKDARKLSTYERELHLLQIKNVVLETLPNLVTQIVPEIVRSFSVPREDLEYPEEEEIPASHIQDICDKTSVSLCNEHFLCSICHLFSTVLISECMMYYMNVSISHIFFKCRFSVNIYYFQRKREMI